MSDYSQASMDWDNLKFFLALAETGSLSRASEKLRVDHSTVARRIEMLEQDLGVRLVERLSRSYRLTAEGERVRDRAKEIQAGIADIARFAQSVDRSPHRAVRVSGPPTFLSQFLAPRLLPLQAEQPRKGLWRGGWRSWHTGFTGRAITSPDAARAPRIFLATMTASITCRSSVG